MEVDLEASWRSIWRALGGLLEVSWRFRGGVYHLELLVLARKYKQEVRQDQYQQHLGGLYYLELLVLARKYKQN